MGGGGLGHLVDVVSMVQDVTTNRGKFWVSRGYDWLQNYSLSSRLKSIVFRTPDYFQAWGVPYIFSDSWTIEKCKHNQIKTTKQAPKNQLMEL